MAADRQGLVVRTASVLFLELALLSAGFRLDSARRVRGGRPLMLRRLSSMEVAAVRPWVAGCSRVKILVCRRSRLPRMGLGIGAVLRPAPATFPGWRRSIPLSGSR